MRNFKSILKCVKPLTMHFYKNGLKNSFEISKKDIEKNEVSLLNFGKPNLANFKFV